MHPLYEEAKKLIAGGSNLYSKRPELHHPENWPTYYREAKGAVITGLDGRRWLDFSGAGVGAAVLGWADADVDAAVIRTIQHGSTSALLAPEEVELARLMVLLHPWARMCRFTRSGGEAMTVAIRIAQAYTGKPNIIHAGGYHGWHVSDPRNGDQFIRWVEGQGLAAIIIEPSRLKEPEPGELEKWRQRAEANGALLIYDEISSGFRRNLGGVHLNYSVTPDIAVFSKAMANGYPMGAVIGTEAVMAAAERTFISSTAWSERIGPTAAVATIQKMWAEDVFAHTEYIGSLIKNVVKYEAQQAGIEVSIAGPPQMLHLDFKSPEVQTLYTQLMMDHGILAGRDFYPTYAHTIEQCEQFSYAAKKVFHRLNDTKLLRGPAVGFGPRR